MCGGFIFIMEKKCSKCKEIKDCVSFGKDKGKADGLDTVCKDCRKAYYLKNKNRINERTNQHYHNNKDRFKQWNAEHYRSNPDLHKAKKDRLKENNPDYFKKYYKKNKEKKQKYLKEYSKNNRDKINERFNTRYHTDPQFRIAQTYRNRLRVTIKKGYKTSKSLDLLGCTIPELKTYLESRFLPTMTWENYGTVWHIDHIKPCAFYDLTDPKQQAECFHYTNLQPLFARTTIIDGVTYIGNLEKGDTILH